jgi:hypothetical protein
MGVQPSSGDGTGRKHGARPVSQRLSTAFPDVPADIVHGTVQHYHQQFAGCPIRDFMPVLVERMTRTGPTAAGRRGDRPDPRQPAPTVVSHPHGPRLDAAEITG